MYILFKQPSGVYSQSNYLLALANLKARCLSENISAELACREFVFVSLAPV